MNISHYALRTSSLLLIAAFAFGAPTAASAQTVLIDVGDGQGTPTSPDTNGNYWNLIDTTNTPLSLTSTTNASTGWSLSIIGTEHAGHQFTGGLDALSTGAPSDFAIAGAYEDQWYDNSNGSPVTFSFTGLAVSTSYTIDLWGSRQQSSSNSWADGLVSIVAGSATGGPTFNLLDGSAGNVLTLNAITDASGVFSFDFDRGTGPGGSAGINVMSLTLVPEPGVSALLMGGLGMVVMLRRARHRA